MRKDITAVEPSASGMNVKLLFAVIGFAALVFLGWPLHSAFLTRSFVSPMPMNPIAAIGIIFISIELIGQNIKADSLKWWRIGIIIPIIFGLFKLSDVIFGIPFHIDTWLFPEELLLEKPKANTMAPNTAIELIVMSISALFLRKRSGIYIWISQVLAVSGGLIAMLAIIGYTYKIRSFYGIGAYNPMALNTAGSFLLLTWIILFTNVRRGFMRYLINDGVSGRVAKFSIPASIFIPFGVGWLRLEGQRAGYYDSEFGVALFVSVNIITLCLLTVISSKFLYTTDLKRKKAEIELRVHASHDSLTGLLNRRLFLQYLQTRIERGKRQKIYNYMVFYLDVDGLKQVNDQSGHTVGDELLVRVAEVLRQCSRASDTVSRLGGDEFTILFDDIKDHKDAEIIADRIIKAVPKTLSGDNFSKVGISIGIAFGNSIYDNSQKLLIDADAALYDAKAKGKGCYCYADPEQPI